MGAAGGAKAICSGKGGWREVAGLSGVVAAGDRLRLSNDNVLRPESAARGDGDCPKPSAFPASGGLTACCLPFLTSVACYTPACSRWNFRSSSKFMLQRVFLVFKFWGIRLHLCFFGLQREQAPLEFTMQVSPNFLHRSHYCCL